MWLAPKHSRIAALPQNSKSSQPSSLKVKFSSTTTTQITEHRRFLSPPCTANSVVFNSYAKSDRLRSATLVVGRDGIPGHSPAVAFRISCRWRSKERTTTVPRAMDSFLLHSSSFRLALRRLPPASELPAPPSLLLFPAMEPIVKIR